jgi:cytochrome P450
MTERDGNSATVDFDPADVESLQDPYPRFAAFRKGTQLRYSRAHGGFWVACRYDEVRDIASQPNLFSSAVGTTIPALANARPLIPLEVDPPAHSRFRKLLSPYFTRRRAEELEPEIRRQTVALIDDAVAKGRVDLVRELAFPQSMRAMWQPPLLGYPSDAPDVATDGSWEDTFREWVLSFKDAARTTEGAARIGSYVERHLESRRREPRDDIPTMLLDAHVDGRQLSAEERIDILFILFTAGTSTTVAALGTILWFLACHDEARAELLDDPQRIPTAIEELLRYAGPSQAERRVVTDETKVAGADLRAGDSVCLLWGSANRDEEEFEHADDVRLDRLPNRHMAFGHGVHLCIGKDLARVQLRVAVEEVLSRMPRFRLVGGAPLRWTAGLERGLEELWVDVAT